MAEDVIPTEPVEKKDPIENLYKNAKAKLNVGTIDDFRKLMSDKDSRDVIYKEFVLEYGDSVKSKIGKDVDEFTSKYGGQKKNTASRFSEWWSEYFIPCCSKFKWVIMG